MSEPRLSSDQALLHAAIDAFGRYGLEGVGTRDIAGKAGKPMSAITYHFGGKEGLYLACARFIAAQMGAMMTPALDHAAALCQTDGSRPQAREALTAIFAQLIQAMVLENTAPFSRFILREQMEPSAAFDILYGGVMGTIVARIAELLAIVADGTLPMAEARVRAIALIGQVMVFRMGRAAVLRTTGWADVGPGEAAMITDMIQKQLAAILDALERGNGR
jgi:AcrR family transcriptional regulator